MEKVFDFKLGRIYVEGEVGYGVLFHAELKEDGKYLVTWEGHTEHRTARYTERQAKSAINAGYWVVV